MKHFLGGIVFCAFASVSPMAWGDLYDLTNTGPDNSYDNGDNFTNGTGTGTVPGPNDDLHIFPGYTTAADDGTILVRLGGPTTVTLTTPNDHGLDDLVVSSSFGANSAGSGILNLSFTNGSTLAISGDTGIVGGVTVNYSGNLTATGENFIVGGAASNITDGTSGTGTLNLTNGTVDLTGENVSVGDINAGSINQGAGSTVIAPADLQVGGGAAGSYSLASGAVLDLGQGATVFLGEGSGGVGTLNINGSTINSTGQNDGIVLGTNGGTGTVIQTASNVTLNSALDIYTGSYMLQSGSLVIDGSTDLLQPYTLAIGNGGTTGQLMQSGGTLTVGSTTTVAIGGGSGTSGLYSISAGTATFNTGILVDATGTITQTGGTLTMADGTSIDLSTSGATYNLDGGILQVGTGGLTGTANEGTFNFGGGTLQTTGNLTDALDGTLIGNSTINAAGTVILSGTLTGNGALTVAAGTLQAGTTNLPGISGVALHSGATFNLTASGNATDTFAGTISGTGNLETGNAGVTNSGAATTVPGGYQLIVPKSITLTGGTTTIAAGTGLQVASGTLNTINGGTGSKLEIGGAAGAGAFTILGTATVSALKVDTGSSLQAGSVVGNLTSNGQLGTLAPETTLSITGSFNQPEAATVAQEGTLVVRTNGTTSDVYTATSANLYGTVRVVGVGSNTYNIVVTSAPGQLTTGTLNSRTAGGLAASPNSVLFTSTLSYAPAAPPGAQILQLTTVQNNIAPFAKTPNQAAVGRAIDTIIQNPPASFAPILLGLDSLTASGLPGALDQLTPESYLYMRDIAFENTTFLAQRVDGFLSNLRTGFSGLDTSGLSILGPGLDSKLGQSLGSLLAYNNEGSAPNGVNYYPDDGESAPLMVEPSPNGPSSPAGPAVISDSMDPRMAPTVAPPPSTSIFDGSGVGFNEFISGNVILGELNDDHSGNQPKANLTAGNATAGVSFRMNSNLAAGVLFDYNHTDALTSAQGSHVRVDSYSPGLFATFFKNGFYANGLFTFGYNNYSDDRKISFGGYNASASSKPDGEQYAPNLDVGYDFHPDRHWVIGPTAGIGYTHLDVDSFHESGAGPADLSVSSQSADSLRARLGGRLEYLVHAGSILFQPNFSASFQHEFLNDPYTLTSQLDVPGTPSFATQGSNPGRNTGLITFGLTTTLDNSMNLFLNYLAEIGGDDYFVQSVEGGLKASF